MSARAKLKPMGQLIHSVALVGPSDALVIAKVWALADAIRLAEALSKSYAGEVAIYTRGKRSPFTFRNPSEVTK